MPTLWSLVLLACAVQQAPQPASAPSIPAKAEAVAAPDCPDTLTADYLAARESLNRCGSSEDCRQVWPGACPHGPYFVDRRADAGPVQALENQLEACSSIECEPPLRLEPPGCVEGRCVPGAAALPR